MKLKEIALKVGSGLIRDMVPGGGLLLDGVNALLGDGDKLGPDATGDDLLKLPPQVLEKQYDVQIEQIRESHETARTMLQVESVSTHTTRPRIALGAFHVVAAVSLIAVAVWASAVLRKDVDTLKVVVDGWPFLLAVIGPFVGWLNRYFGILKDEHRNRLDAVSANTKPRGLAGLLQSVRAGK